MIISANMRYKGDCISRKETVKRLHALAARRQGSLAGDAFAFAAKVVLGVPAVNAAPANGSALPYAERRAVYARAIEQNGEQLQAIVALEELSEAQKEICKMLRGDGSIEHFAEEIADATIMLEQLRMIFGINEAVGRWMDRKVQRLADRLERRADDGL